MTATPLSQTRALGGVRVLDLSSVVFGPYASQILADYGADVVKVEAPAGDSTRRTGPAQEPGLAAIFLGLNRNKRSIVLDLKQPSAREALLALADQADVLMHSMRPAKMEALGLGPETLCARNPRLVYAGLYGFGAGGAYDGRPAYDDIIQGLSGLADLVDRQTGTPRYLPTVAADKTCGLVAAHAILAALFQRERTGRGQQLEVPMFESMASFALVEHYYGRHLRDEPGEAGYPRALTPNRRPCRTADGHICLMPYTDAHWRGFFIAAGRPDLAEDPRFADISARTRNIEALYELQAGIVAAHDTAYWLALCERLEIPAARINRLQDLENDPHLQSVDFFVPLESACGSRYRFVRNPVRMQHSQVPPAMPPRLGEHTREVLRQAGLDDARIDALLETGAARDALSATLDDSKEPA
ncbi:CoA transferase [Achromobacter xylosoxidans]|jgi:crotonobetainyl-CoA:carnitine CoA-transferase CaiB-like acyl-CoA transferase|uniref:CaiB/BaiF CoA transferase family protein n=1 Tax=Achromobacter sp. HZ01 TaxID=1416886 RepID=UPI000DD01F65|nr:CoA transferase [Achromobacter sp. HZ01]MBO9330975.1 CoA transferase [Achromobacter xylosoxidans]